MGKGREANLHIFSIYKRQVHTNQTAWYKGDV
jgi:hypothetical protein